MIHWQGFHIKPTQLYVSPTSKPNHEIMLLMKGFSKPINLLLLLWSGCKILQVSGDAIYLGRACKGQSIQPCLLHQRVVDFDWLRAVGY